MFAGTGGPEDLEDLGFGCAVDRDVEDDDLEASSLKDFDDFDGLLVEGLEVPLPFSEPSPPLRPIGSAILFSELDVTLIYNQTLTLNLHDKAPPYLQVIPLGPDSSTWPSTRSSLDILPT